MWTYTRPVRGCGTVSGAMGIPQFITIARFQIRSIRITRDSAHFRSTRFQKNRSTGDMRLMLRISIRYRASIDFLEYAPLLDADSALGAVPVCRQLLKRSTGGDAAFLVSPSRIIDIVAFEAHVSVCHTRTLTFDSIRNFLSVSRSLRFVSDPGTGGVQ
jgi:hypothetical protein